MSQSLDETVIELERVKARIAKLKQSQATLETAVRSEMNARGATELRTEKHVVTLETRLYNYDYSILSELREILGPDDLRGIYYPEHKTTEVIRHPESWDMNKGRRLVRLGSEVQEIISRSRTVTDGKDGRPKPKIVVQDKST